MSIQKESRHDRQQAANEELNMEMVSSKRNEVSQEELREHKGM